LPGSGCAISRTVASPAGSSRAQGAAGRIRRIAIVALARKLLVSLWRYLTQGLVPDGAALKAAQGAAAARRIGPDEFGEAAIGRRRG
jgi:hypothetical protein